MHKVKFLTKDTQENNLVTERAAVFSSFMSAVHFVQTINNNLPKREVLLGRPEIEVFA
jgi:hypothetical protein